MGHDIKFLLVEDISTMRLILKTYLHRMGYPNVQETDNGSTALPMLKDGNFDFLITEWNIPGLPGLELLKAVRSDPKLARMPVLLLTAERRRAQLVVAEQAGVSGYMVKPFTAQTLKKKLEKILHGESAAATGRFRAVGVR